MTPEQIKALIESGKLTDEDVALFSPQEKAIYLHIRNQAAKQTPPPGMKAPAAADKSGGGGVGTALGEGAWNALNSPAIQGQLIGMLAAPFAAGASAAAPELGVGAGGALGRAAIQAGKNALPWAKKGAVGYGLGYAADKMGLPGPLRDMLEMLPMFYSGEKGAASRPGPIEGGSTGSGSNVQKVSRDVFDAIGRGPVTEESAAHLANRPPTYPPNVNTQSSTADLLEMLTGSSHGRGESPTPVMFHNGDPENLRSSIGKLKRKVVPKKPQSNDDDND